MAKNYTIDAVRGDSLPMRLSFTDANGGVVDITGWTVSMTIKRNRDDADAAALVQKVVTEHDDPEGGVTSLILGPTETQLLGSYWYDVQYVSAQGMVTTAVIGNIHFAKDITRSI